nr:hypothetical protein [Tanacetum cinerariifolium]
EPGVAHDRARDRFGLAQAQLQRCPGLAEDVPVQAHVRARGSGGRDATAGEITQTGDQHHRRRNNRCVMSGRHHDPRADGPGKDRQKGAHLHQTIAAHQFVFMQHFDHADQLVFGVLLAELPGQRREQEERENEQQRAQVDVDRAVTVDGQFVEDGEDQRLLEDVVVERPEGLRHEKRQEPPFAQQIELRLTHQTSS